MGEQEVFVTEATVSGVVEAYSLSLITAISLSSFLNIPIPQLLFGVRPHSPMVVSAPSDVFQRLASFSTFLTVPGGCISRIFGMLNIRHRSIGTAYTSLKDFG